MRVSIERPDNYGDVVARYLPLLLISGAALIVGRYFRADQLPLIPCYFKLLTGRPCPFCGYTRAFTEAGHDFWAVAWMESPMGCVLYALAGLAFVFSATALLSLRIVRIAWPPGSGRVALWAVIALVLANWCYRLAAGLR